MVKTAIEEGIDLIVPGAGFSRDVFGMGRESGTPIVTMVSNIKGAKLAERLGASAVVVEGKEAGGHLGTDQSMRVVLPEIKKEL
jgi:NAD(P)H-dependent flavin oxidoreductase YrpB (nitropropane dioxygenase family)